MNIKVPNGIKSPTIIIVGRGTADEKKNDFHSKRMDNLEKKLDQQYKAFSNNTGFERKFDQLSKSFGSRIDKLISSNKSLMSSTQEKRITELQRTLDAKIRSLKKEDNSEILDSFVKKFEDIERIIKKLPSKQMVKVVNSGSGLNGSFEKMITRLETAIRKSGPRMIPSPM